MHEPTSFFGSAANPNLAVRDSDSELNPHPGSQNPQTGSPIRLRNQGRHTSAYLTWKGLLVLGTIGAVVGSFFVRSEPIQLEAQPSGPLEVDRDRDGDGLPDRLEAYFQTSPDQLDTDGDGLSDGHEIALGKSPIIPEPLPDEDGSTEGGHALTEDPESGIVVIALNEPRNRVSFLIVATSASQFRNVSTAVLAMVRDESLPGPVPNNPSVIDFDTAGLLVDRTRAFLRAGVQTVSDDGQVISLTLPSIHYSSIPRFSGIVAAFEEDGTSFEAVKYFGIRTGNFYEISFNADNGEQGLTGSHIFHVRGHQFGEDPILLDENEDCKQYYTPIGPGNRYLVITREQCEDRDGFFCPADCGSEAGRIIFKL